MKRFLLSSAIVTLAAAPLVAGGHSVNGSYVEARTAEVFTGACIMGSEAETMGKEAVLAWKVDRGSFNGISLDGLSIVAAVAGDKNLGIQEVGGGKAVTRSTLFVDQRANPAQQLALVVMASDLSKGTLGTIVNVSPAPIRFLDGEAEVQVAGGPVTLEVSKHAPHEETCGAMQWFHPLSAVDEAEIGLTAQHSFTGSGLGSKWSDPNRRSSFFGTFSK
jgi:uncharacterized protein DUF1326